MVERMTKSKLQRVGVYLRAALRLAGRAAAMAIPRGYAIALFVLITWTTWMAVRYLVTSLASADTAPTQITNLPTRLDRAALGAERSAFDALDAAEHPRSPLAHYHRLDNWIRPDPFNDCTRSGCHGPLPHSRSQDVRAFLNMHATSIHCGVCHFNSEHRPRKLVWYDQTTGRPGEPPAILRAQELVTGPDAPARWKKADASDQRELVRLIRLAARDGGGLRSLDQLADHLEAYRVGSRGFEQVLAEAPAILRRHCRGEYGAKLAMVAQDGSGPQRGHPRTNRAVSEWLANQDTTDAELRARLLNAVHPLRREQALNCTDCHAARDSLVDFAAMGYPREGIERFVAPTLFRMIEHIHAGRPFNLPGVLEDDTAKPPGTRP
jgi:hypothetical protein